MNFKLNSEQQQLQDSVRRYIDKTYPFDVRAARVRAHKGSSPEHWQSFADNGWLAAALPEAYGGLGGNLIDTVLIAQEFGRALVVEPYLGCAVLAAQVLAAGGTAAQKDGLLPLLADGSLRIALAYSEVESRGMPLPVATTARRGERGYLLNGRKSLVLSGGIAQQYIVSAHIAGAPADELTLFIVDADAAGLARQELPLHDGSWAEELVLDGVEVDAEAILGDAGRGLEALHAGFVHGIVVLCAELVGAMEKVIEITADHLKTRQQFGASLGSFQALQHRIADMAVELETARSMLFAALDSVENGDAETRRRTLSATKALVGRAAKFVCGQGIQLHGGIGVTEEYLVGHYFKRAVVAELQLGSIDRHEAACMA